MNICTSVPSSLLRCSGELESSTARLACVAFQLLVYCLPAFYNFLALFASGQKINIFIYISHFQMIKISSFLLFFVCVAFSASVCDAYDNGAPHSRLPALGWSSWVALGPEAEHPIFDFCDETSVKAAIDAFVSDDLGLFDAGYRHFHLDDCWAGGRNSSGYLFPEKNNRPNGMKPVIDYAHSKGVVFGLYTCAGTLTCVGRRPGSKDHWKEDAALWAEWGVDWVKMDW